MYPSQPCTRTRACSFDDFRSAGRTGLHFIEKEPSSVGLLLVLLADDQPADPLQYPSRESLSAAMTSLLTDVDRLYAAWGVPEPIAQANCDAATASYFEFVEANLSGRSLAS